MHKKVLILIVMAVAFSMVLAACGDAETASPSGKVTATATMDAGEMPIDVIVDTSKGYSVLFDNDGFFLFEGEYDDSTYPLVTATILKEDVYNKYIEDNKDREDFREDNGFIKYTSSIDEPVCLYKIGDRVPFMMSFEKGVDGEKADEIIGCLEFDYDYEDE